jgi:predicted dehydrogenase
MTSWGVISTANINDMVLAGAQASDRVDVIAVASRDAARAEAYAREKGIERSYGSYEAMLADDDVQAVYVSLPNSLHAEWSIRALEAGKHVLCEKPLSRHPADVERAFDAAERSGRLLMEAFMYRHHPQIARARELVEQGAIGRLRAIRALFSFSLADTTNIRMLADLDGGALMDLGCYCVSGSRLFGGEPEHARGEQVVGPTGVDVAFHGTLRFPDDVVAQFHAAFVLRERQELEAIGEEGSLLLTAPYRADFGGDVTLTSEGKVEVEPVPEADPYRLELENLGDAIEGRGDPLLGRADALGQARTIEALYRSAAEGRAIEL